MTTHGAQATNYTHYFYKSDGAGNVQAVVDTNGTFVATYAYDPFGGLFSQSGSSSNISHLRFSSQEWHPQSGLYFYEFRAYDPTLQRWLTADPIGLLGDFNLYRFARNNPLMWSDAFGLSADEGSLGSFIGNSLSVLNAVGEALNWLGDATGVTPPGSAKLTELLAGINPMFAYEAQMFNTERAAGLGGERAALEAAESKAATTPPVASNPCPPPLYGPFHHFAKSEETVKKIQNSGELWGAPPRNIYASDIPAVKAFYGPLPEGQLGVEFMTQVAPDAGGGFLGSAKWTGPRDGVTVVPYTWAKIPISITKVNSIPTKVGN
jgi:RHS repeat-associated protein